MKLKAYAQALLIGAFIIAIVAALIWGVERWRPPPPPLPELANTTKPVMIRLYADMGHSGDSFILIATDKSLCYVEQGEWLAAIVGRDVECLWRPQ